MSQIIAANEKSILKAAQILRDGGLVGMPTETVYGLAADATNGQAVARIFEAKGRPSFNPLISHFSDARDIDCYAIMDERAKLLAAHFWPGPLTMILPRREDSGLSDLVSAGLPSVAVRVPAHRVARDLIAAAGVPLAAPSANKSGSLSPTSPVHVQRSLGAAVDLILAAGVSEVGLESTVVSLASADGRPVLMRHGAISVEEIADILGEDVELWQQGDNIASPGQLLKHYAPRLPLRLDAVDVRLGEALLGFGSLKFMGVQGGGYAQDLPDGYCLNLSPDGDLTQAAANLFAMLHRLDELEDCAGIAVMSIPRTGLGIAINDRLKRAAQ